MRSSPRLALTLTLTLTLGLSGVAKADDTPDATTGEVAIGTRVDPELAFIDTRHLRRRLDDLGPRKATVIVAVTTSCPIARKYLPRLVELEAAHREQGARFVLLGVSRGDLPLDLAATALEHGVSFPALLDRDGAAVRALGLTRTPEVVVLDAEGRIAYRGRIDDQHRVGASRSAATRDDLREALADVLAGRAVRVSHAPAEGCKISSAPPVLAAEPPTWAAIAPILERRCVSCHHQDGGAPFALDTYEGAWALADQVEEVVRDGRMPPWHASPAHGTFANDARLTLEERQAISTWVHAGAPLGDPRAAPTISVPAPTGGWRIGPPDAVVSTVEPAKLPATGDVPYQYELLPYVFEEDTWVSGLEIRPTNPAVMHHCNLAYLLPGGSGRDTNFVSGQVPGGEAMNLDPGLGFLFPKGATLVLQIHYVTTGKPETCKIEVGMRWPRGPVTKRVRHVVIHRSDLAIPPGERFHEVRATKRLEHDATVLAMFTHMHLRGRDMTFVAHRPDGADETLMAVPSYDFEWQRTYHVKPGAMRLPKGTRIECIGHYDNSSWNPFNPDPTATIHDGPQTKDEMFFGFFFYTDDAETLDLRVDPSTGHALSR